MIALLNRRRKARAVASLVEAIMATTEWFHTGPGQGSRRAVIDGQAVTVKASGFSANATVRINGAPDIRLGIDDSARVDSHTERYADHQRNLRRILDAVAAKGSAA